MRDATANDEVLFQTTKSLESGQKWHTKEPILRRYLGAYPELSIVDGVVMRGTQIVLPEKLQNRVTEICQEGHLKLVKSKQLLGSKVWFKGTK